MKAKTEIFNILEKNNLLPTMDSSEPVSFIGEEGRKFIKEILDELAARKDIDRLIEMRDAMQSDLRDLAEMLLDMEVHMGELLLSGQERPKWVSRKLANQCRKLAENPEIVERIKRRARGEE